MPRILLIAYFYPPAWPIGAVRAAAIAQNLARLGWQVDVLTTSESFWGEPNKEPLNATENLTLIRSSRTVSIFISGAKPKANSIRSLATRVFNRGARMLKRENGFLWQNDGIAAAKRHYKLANTQPDVVMCTMSPFFQGAMASTLAKWFQVPFVLDYRDLSQGNSFPRISNPTCTPNFLSNESAWLESCAMVTTVSPSLAHVIGSRLSKPEKCKVVHNGFREEEFDQIEGDSQFDGFTITYAGIFYTDRAPIDPLFAALRILSEQDGLPDWKFHYLGFMGEYVKSKALEYGISERVVTHGYVPRANALAFLKSSDLLTVITSTTATPSIAENGIVTAKIFDCLAVRRPILMISPAGSDAAKIIEETNSGESASGHDPQLVADAMHRAISCQGKYEFRTEEYKWRSLGAKLDNMLRDCIQVPTS